MSKPEMSIAEIAHETGLSPRRLAYAAATRGISPSKWIGTTRLFDASAVRAILKAVDETTRRPCPGRPIKSRSGRSEVGKAV